MAEKTAQQLAEEDLPAIPFGSSKDIYIAARPKVAARYQQFMDEIKELHDLLDEIAEHE